MRATETEEADCTIGNADGAPRPELLGSWTWMAVTFGYMMAPAYAASFATYHIAVALGAG